MRSEGEFSWGEFSGFSQVFGIRKIERPCGGRVFRGEFSGGRIFRWANFPGANFPRANFPRANFPVSNCIDLENFICEIKNLEFSPLKMTFANKFLFRWNILNTSPCEHV